MVLAGDLRKGVTIEYEGKVYTVVDFLHVKPGKGAAFVRTTLKNVVEGKTLQITFNPTEKFENAIIETKKMTYSYNDGEFYYFMDEEYNMEPLTYDQVEEALKWIKENDPVTVKFYKGKAFSVDCENFVELLVTESEPGVPATPRPTPPKKRNSKRALKFRFPCSSTRVKPSGLTLVPANTWKESRSNFKFHPEFKPFGRQQKIRFFAVRFLRIIIFCLSAAKTAPAASEIRSLR